MDLLQGATAGIEGERGDGQRMLVDVIAELAVGAENQVARMRVSGGRREGRLRGTEFTRGGVKAIGVNAVEASIAAERELITRSELRGMTVRLLLWAQRRMLIDPSRRRELAVGTDGEGGDTAVAVIRNDDRLTRLINREVARAVAVRGLGVDRGKLTVGSNREARNRATLRTSFTGREKVFMVRVNRDPGRIAHRPGEFWCAHFARSWVQPGHVDALALLARISADVDQDRARLHRFGGERWSCDGGQQSGRQE